MTTGHGWVDKLKLTQDLYYPYINKQLNQSKIMIFFNWKYTLLREAIKNVSIWTQRDFLEVSRNVQIWRHFGTPFVLVLSRKPHENVKACDVWGPSEEFWKHFFDLQTEAAL